MTTDKKKQGFHEDVDPLLGKAKKHSIVAQKNKFEKEQFSDGAIVPVPDEGDIVTLRYEYSEEFKELAGQFEEENDILLEIDKDGDDIVVDIPVENSADFIEFLAENDIKVKEEAEEAVDNEKAAEVSDTDKKDDAVDSSEELKCTVDKIIADVQSKRSKRAVTSDKLRTAKRVGEKDNAVDLISWLKNPGKSDLSGIDTPDVE